MKPSLRSPDLTESFLKSQSIKSLPHNLSTTFHYHANLPQLDCMCSLNIHLLSTYHIPDPMHVLGRQESIYSNPSGIKTNMLLGDIGEMLSKYQWRTQRQID